MRFPAPGRPGRLVPVRSSVTRLYHHNFGNEIKPSNPVEDGEDFDETLDEWKSGVLTDTIHQMMFVISRDKTEPSAETTTMIEEIVQKQVRQMLRKANESAARRGSRSINPDDIFFLIRKHKDKLARLKDHLSWKDVRKTAKDSDGKGGDTADLGAVDDSLVRGEGTAGATGPAAIDTTKKIKRTKITLPWDVSSYYSEQVPERDDDDEVEEMNAATVERLRLADEQTKGMTKEEYVHFSECRQASFTFRKSKRFREWAGFAAETDGKPSDDIVDMLGYLMCEVVQRLTKEALKVKMEEDRAKSRKSDGAAKSLKRKRETGLFDAPAENQTPIEPVHLQEAYRRLQENPIPGQGPQPWFGGPRILHRRELQLI